MPQAGRLVKDTRGPAGGVNLKISLPCVMKMSRGAKPAIADTVGATAIYLSKHCPEGKPGIVVNGVGIPRQSIDRSSGSQNWVASRVSGEPATPMGPALKVPTMKLKNTWLAA